MLVDEVVAEVTAAAQRRPRPGRTVVVMPAYNAAKTLAPTVRDIPAGSVDEIILVDDCSRDDTVERARQLGLTVLVHSRNCGYGGNQKTCYREALRRQADYIVMIHPDYQYDSRLIPVAVEIIRLGICDVVLGSRIRTRHEALQGGMPWWKYVANRLLTLTENITLGQNLGDFHSGFRAYHRSVLDTIPFWRNSDDFVFDSQFLAQAVSFGFKVGDIPVPVRYFDEASSINFRRSITYGFRTLEVLVQYGFHRWGLRSSTLFQRASSEERERFLSAFSA
ncbi:MAG: glycosyl transferase family 2 [Planctomycetaceae bacterium]|nr:MAG: glycosyl transferase family 2 [Planctomycetaceae bacterium]